MGMDRQGHMITSNLCRTLIFSKQNQLFLPGLAYDVQNRIQFLMYNIPMSPSVTMTHSPGYPGPSFLQGMVIRFCLPEERKWYSILK